MPIKTPPPLLTTMDDDDDRNKSNTNVLMTVGQVTAFLGYKDVHFVLRLLNNGELKGHRIGKKWLIWRRDVVSYIESRSNQKNDS